MDRETVLWALVFSVPPGVGITGFAAFVIGRGFLDPLAVVAGLVTTLVLFALVAFMGTYGSADEERDRYGAR